jgi:hypothetical protein
LNRTSERRFSVGRRRVEDRTAGLTRADTFDAVATLLHDDLGVRHDRSQRDSTSIVE